MTLAEATSPTADTTTVPCHRRHTSVTYRVGRLDQVVDGHLLAVDAARVQRQVGRTCSGALRGYLGARGGTLPLSRFKPVWFTPSLQEADAGARWYRCDAVALATARRLAPIPRRVRGVLRSTTALTRFGTCAASAPGSRRFAHVICSRPHRWQAVSTVDLTKARYLGPRAQRAAESTCSAIAKQLAGGSLSYTSAFEWPPARDWRAGRRYGLCWAPG